MGADRRCWSPISVMLMQMATFDSNCNLHNFIKNTEAKYETYIPYELLQNLSIPRSSLIMVKLGHLQGDILCSALRASMVGDDEVNGCG